MQNHLGTGDIIDIVIRRFCVVENVDLPVIGFRGDYVVGIERGTSFINNIVMDDWILEIYAVFRWVYIAFTFFANFVLGSFKVNWLDIWKGHFHDV